MPHIPPEEYYRTLPAKRMASGVIFRNKEGKILMVKTLYKEGWSLPGGTIDRDESPRACAIREVKEEIGLDVADVNLICVDYTNACGIKTESIQFVFSGGVLNGDQISRIVVQSNEIEKAEFLSEQEAITVANPKTSARLPVCFQAEKDGRTAYIESFN